MEHRVFLNFSVNWDFNGVDFCKKWKQRQMYKENLWGKKGQNHRMVWVKKKLL